MAIHRSRRDFLKAAATGAALTGWGGNARARAATASRKGTAVVALDPAIEPLVRLLEETPRNRIVETFAAKVRDGQSYKSMLAALLLAAVRNVEPRPSVGFKFHSVLVVQSIHLASTPLPEDERWLPVFWALDYFKTTQAADERERDWTMAPVDESALPPAAEAPRVFHHAMEEWNEAAADAAVAGLARSAPPQDIWESFFRYGGRDYRSIGHKAINVANNHRVLGLTGWQHAEPVLRSLAYALLMHEGESPARRDDPADRPWRRNQDLADQIPAGWQRKPPDRRATVALLETLREGSESDASQKVVELIERGAGPQSIWDALFLGSAELVVRQAGIVALHAVTTTNALHYSYQATRDDQTRRLILLQNAAFLPMFRQSMRGRGQVRDFALDRLEPAEFSGQGAEPLEEIFAEVGRDSMEAGRKTLAYVQAKRPLEPWIGRSRRLMVQKGTSVHDYKFACAVYEDAEKVSPQWLGHYLAAATFLVPGASRQDNPLIAQSMAALAGAP